MICTKKPLTQQKSLLNQELNLDKKQQLMARWKKKRWQINLPMGYGINQKDRITQLI